MDFARLAETLEKQARPHQSNHGERDFGDYKRSPQPVGLTVAAASSFLQSVVDIGAAQRPRRERRLSGK